MKKEIFFVLIVLLMLGCNQEKKDSNKQIKEVQSEQKKVKNQLVIDFNVIVEKDGAFTLFFLEEGEQNITTKNSQSIEVFGSSDPQSLIFTIRENIIPDKLFLRFVNEGKDQTLEFKTTTLSYGSKTITIQPNLFFQFFMPNKFVDYDSETFRATTKEINGNYLPRFSSRDVLIEKMLIEF